MDFTKSDSSGALSHLVEAATALANLTSSTVTETTTNSPAAKKPQASKELDTSSSTKKHIISDEEQEATTPNNRTSTAPVSKEIFPARLMAILNDASLSEIITWLPHGRSFVIIRPDVFTEQVLPKYLPPADARTSTKYPSFTRKLNRWGFRQATRGPDTGAFHHPLFVRDKPELCQEMVCQRSRDRRNLPAKKRHMQLTKESLDRMNASTAMPAVATVSVSGDSSSSSTTPSAAALQQGITSDASLTQKALMQRNEEERMRVAKAMLYHAYLEAIQRKGSAPNAV